MDSRFNVFIVAIVSLCILRPEFGQCSEPRPGYCKDNKTPSDGPNQEGCPLKLCYDTDYGKCDSKFAKQYCGKDVDVLSVGGRMDELCPYSCGVCKPPAATCSKGDENCCWLDGSTSLQNCPPCEDDKESGRFCSRFKHFCLTGNYENVAYMKKTCPYSCGYCY